jgi:hypothetical protein
MQTVSKFMFNTNMSIGISFTPVVLAAAIAHQYWKLELSG